MDRSTLLLAAILVATNAPAQKLVDRLDARVHRSEEHGELPYRLFKPAVGKAGTKYPPVLFLHGAGERGTNNTAQLRHGVRDFVSADNQRQRLCFLIAPQCPRGVWWRNSKNHAMFIELLESVRDEYPIDADRIYITGLSMRGYGTWHAIAANPGLFAAAMSRPPVSSRGCRSGPSTATPTGGRRGSVPRDGGCNREGRWQAEVHGVPRGWPRLVGADLRR